ncbi:hypothetical protein CURE108131_20825 [Cupriavidus respiraculi]|uniref:Uncharacterized protein n=1 Tax=Cupriavidus respiraculi TaxID=195930 RepID=A0ABM8X049_9BURK|nr:hypothetical protein [Cupriavidus respiraculi]CAG9173219.1 hypothetical protein LMG21510_02189 [Cupriavidus respiraculi]
MSWPIGTPVRAAQHVDADIVDLARESTELKRQNAELRRQLLAAERAAATADEARQIAHQAHAVMSLQIAQLEKLAIEVKRAAVKNPHWPISRWVKFGPMAGLLATIKEES